MIRVLGAALALMIAPTASWACMPLPAAETKPIAAAVAADMMKYSHKNFIGKVEAIKFVSAKNSGPQVTFKVLKQYAGAPMKEVDVVMRGYNCKSYEPIIGKVEIITARVISEESVILYGSPSEQVANEELEAALDNYTKTESVQ